MGFPFYIFPYPALLPDGLCHKFEQRFPFSLEGHILKQREQPVHVKLEYFMTGISLNQKIEQLFANHQIGHVQYRTSHHIYPLDGKQSEIEQQRLEVAHVRHFQRGEMSGDIGYNFSLFRNLLDDGEVFSQSVVKTDEVGKLVEVRTDIRIYNLLRFDSVQYQ